MMAMDFKSHRSEKRGSSDRQGNIRLGFFKKLACSIDDLSVSGAKLILPNNTKLPERFDLILSGTGKKRTHKCVCRWQSGNTAGVEFLSTKLT